MNNNTSFYYIFIKVVITYSYETENTACIQIDLLQMLYGSQHTHQTGVQSTSTIKSRGHGPGCRLTYYPVQQQLTWVALKRRQRQLQLL